ncbi:MAG: DUF2953 domain-containing protein [Oliverpabstia sp.]|nr:DUF2953 domain-containing protein [Oliverpabstia sp.]
MLHIILTILKILGIILLVFLGIVLAVLLSVLFIPVCYRGQGKKEGEQLEAKASVSWLCYLIHGTVIYESGKSRWELYLFGIPLKKVRDRIKERKRSGKAKKAETAKESFPEENPVVALEEKVEEKPFIAPEKKLEGEPAIAPKEEPEGEPVVVPEEKPERKAGVRLEEKTKEEVSQKEKRESSGVENHKKTEKKQGIWKKISEKIKRVRLTFHNIYANIKEWRSFFALETTKAAFRFLLGKGKGLLHHILPRKIRGKLIFGFEDPALTGQVLGVAAIFYSFYQDKFLLTPVFDRQILEGEIKLSGRIYGVYLLWTAWQIYKNQDVRKVYQKFQDKET